MDRMIGKVTRFNAGRRRGILASIGGMSLQFTHTGAPDGAALTAGQVVSYHVVEGEIIADDVRAERDQG